VRSDRAEIGTERAERDVGVARGRARVDVHEHVALAERVANCRGGLHGSNLVVRELHTDERCRGQYRRDDFLGVEAPESVDAHDGDFGTGAIDRVANTRMLDRGRHDMSAARRSFQRAEDGGVHRFGTR
jgi:hypothetical protein